MTIRAVRERAGVSMAVAAEAARLWNEQAAEQQNVPGSPANVRARLDGIWRAAFLVARHEFDEARAGWVGKVETAEKDAAEPTKSVARFEEQLERERADAQKAQRAAAQELTDARTELTDAQTPARLEGALEAVTAERDGLLVELDAARQVASR